MTIQATHDLLEAYREPFIELLSYHCTLYSTIGSSVDESPMWFQYRGLNNLSLTFSNSQRSSIYFSIPLSGDDVDIYSYCRYDWIYDFFRDLKYSYIKSEYPSIYCELRSL